MALLGLCRCVGFSLVEANGGYCLVAVSRLGIGAASFAAEHSRCGVWASAVAARGLNRCGAWAQLLQRMWDLPRSGIEPVSPALAGKLFTTEPPWKPSDTFIMTENFLITNIAHLSRDYCVPGTLST